MVIDVVVPDQMLAAIFPDGIFIIPTRKPGYEHRGSVVTSVRQFFPVTVELSGTLVTF